MDRAALDEIEQAVMAFDQDAEPTRQPVSSRLDGLADDLVDLVLEQRFAEADLGYRRMQRVLDQFVARRGLAIEHGDGCVAGQIRAFATVLGAIAQRLPKSFETEAKKRLRAPIYQTLCDALMKGEATTKELSAATGEAMETVSRKLSALRNLGLVISYSTGRNVYSRLSPVATDLYDQIRKDRSQPPVKKPILQIDFSPEQKDRLEEMTESHANLGWGGME